MTIKEQVERVVVEILTELEPECNFGMHKSLAECKAKRMSLTLLKVFESAVGEDKQGIKFHSGRQNSELSAYSPIDNQKIGYNAAKQEIRERLAKL